MTTRTLRNAATLSAIIALGAVGSLHASSLTASPPEAPTIISACPPTGIVISEPGDYVLGAEPSSGLQRYVTCNFSSPGINGISITASNVNLSLNNHRFMFAAVGTPAPAPGYGILVRAADGSQLRNVHITGAGAVVGFNVGIRFENVDKASARGVTAANNRTSGIETDGVTRFRLTDSMMARNGTYGLKLLNSVDGRIRGNVMSANGIRTTFSAGISSVFFANPQPGIGIGIHGGGANQILKNTVTGNFGDGIAVGQFCLPSVPTCLVGIGDSFNSFDNEIGENLSSANLSSTGGSFTNLFVATGSLGNYIHDNESLNLEDDNPACGTNIWSNNTFIATFSSNGTSAVNGTIAAPLSLMASNVHTGSLSCAR